MGVANFRVKNGLFVAETSGSAGNLTIVDGQIDSDAGLLLDAAGDITLDAAGSDILLAKNGVNFGQLTNSSDDFVIRSLISDEPMVFKGNDGGVNTTVLTLDMANAGAATFNAGITLGGNITGAADVDTSIIPDAGHYVDIDGLFKVTPSITAHVDLDDTAQGSDANNLTGDANNFINFPESGQVYIESTTASENPYTYTGKNADSSTLTGLTGLDTISASNVMVTLAPKNTTIAGQRYATGQTGQFGADGGQVTIDGGKWGNAASTWAVGVNYGAVILNEATSIMKLDTADVASGTLYKDEAHMQVIPHVKIGSETPNTLTTGTDYFTGYFKTNANSNTVVNEKLFYNQIIHVDTLAMMKIKSSVMNTETQYNDAIGSAMVLETATAGEMNQMLFNFDNTNAERYLSTGSGTLGASGYAYSVGGVYKSAGTSQGGTSASNFGMGYMNRSFNQAGADLNSGPFTNGSGTYGAQGNPLATENTFFQANFSGLVGIGPAQTPSSFATIHVGATGATNVGGVITFDSGSADPSTTANTLYNKGGNIYWGTTNLSASSASALNDLSDVTFSSSSTMTTLTIASLNAFVFANDDDASISVTATTSTTAGKPLTISAGSSATGSNDVNGGDLILASGGGDGTGTSSIQFKTKVSGTDAAAESMRIHTNGFVGIGTATPTSQLSILSDTSSAADSGASLLLASNDGATMGSGHRLGVIEFAGAEDGSGTLTVGARIEAVTEEAFDSSNNDTKLVFYTTSSNASQNAALTLDNSGNATVRGDLDIDGNDLTFGNGASIVNTDSNTLTITEATTIFSGDVRLNGNDIKSSDGTTAITLSGADVTIAGDLNITGDVNSVSVTNLDVDDLTITLAKGAADSSAANNAGISIDGASASLLYSHSGTKFVMNKPLNLSGTTESSSATTGELIVAGGAGIAKDLSVGDDLRLTSDASVFSMGAGADITITHDNSTGGTLASAGAFIIDGEDDLTLDVGDGKDVLLLEAGTTYASIGQGSVDIADIGEASATTIDTFDCTAFQATKYLILVEDTTNTNYMSTEILVLGDENGASTAVGYLTQYAVLFNDTELGDFTVTGSSNNINLQYTAGNMSGASQHKVRVVATRIASI